MSSVLLVSKPIAPPWHDSSKNLVRDLAGHMRRHVPIVLCPKGTTLDLARARTAPVYPAARARFAPGLADNARVLAHLLTGERADLWHFFFAPNPRTSGAARFAARVRRTRTLQTVCSAPRAEADPRAVLFADRVVVLSRHTEQRFLDAGVERQRVRLIRPSIPPLPPLDDEQRRAARAGLGLSLDRPIVLYAGDLEFGSGAELALLAHHDLPRSLEATLVMACRAKTARASARADELRARATSLGVAGSVRWLGETEQIHALLAAADLVTLPTNTLYAKMDLPLVLLEAMSLERAVLVGRGTPAQELADGGAAVCVEVQRDSVSAATESLLRDAARRARIGEAARAAVLERHAPSSMAQAYESLYDELAA